MSRHTGRLSIILTAVAIFSATAIKAGMPPGTLLEAYEVCDKTDLRPIEGLWTYPDDDVTVLIMRSEFSKGVYDIFVVESADCSLSPGMKLGELKASADPDKFTISLFTIVKKGTLSKPSQATATFSENKESLTFKKSSVQFKFNPNRLLPYFWRMISVNVKTREPAPEGMIKVYPSYDGNMSSKRQPRYL